MNYDQANRRWTDTLGRIVNDPLPLNWETQTQTVGDQTASFPGFNGGTMNATFTWQNLQDGLNNTNQALAYPSNVRCQGNATHPITGTNLFGNPEPSITRVCGTTTQFNPVVLTKITLANGQNYQFKYNLYGEIEKIIYPSGGYERFAYAQIAPIQTSDVSYDQANRGVVDRWVSPSGNGTDEVHWTYQVTSGYQQPYKVTITAPDNSKTEQFLHYENSNSPQPYGFGDAKTGRSYEDRVYSTTGQLLRRKLTAYTVTGAQAGGYSGATRDLRPSKEISIVFDAGAALATMSETVYDSNGDPQYFAELNAKQSIGYHFLPLDLNTAQTANVDQIAALFGSNQLATVSEVDYLYNESYKARNIVGFPTVTRIKDAAGNVKAQSQIGYDEQGIINAGSASQWTDPNTAVRGNPTTSRSWTDIGSNQYVETHAQYDNFGNFRKSWDAKGNVSETEYSATYNYAYPTKVITPVPDPSGQNGSSTSFETTMTYDLTTGLPLTIADANGQTTTMEYNDALLRPTKVIPPSGGGQTIMEYGDTPNSMFVKTKTQIDANNWAESTTFADGLGRAIRSQKKDSQGDVFTETEYDQMGRVKRSTNPFRNGETKLWTTSNFDEAGRPKEVITPDNAKVQTSYEIATSGNIGTVITVTDQANKQRRSITNALGQLARVDEPDDNGNLGGVSSPAQPTAYSYDALNNLVQVNQGGQTRTFAYDSLSRLRQAVNPESGTISYNYDANGNLINKTDARNVATTYAYDNLDRIKTRSYSDSTPQVSYFYDNLANTKGKLTRVSSSISETRYTSFDNLGRVLSSSQITDGNTYNFGYGYNLSGMLVSETYPSGRVVTNQFDGDGDLAQVNGQLSGNNKIYADSFNYTAAGAISSMKLGNNRWETAQFNSRLQPVELGLGTTSSDTSLWKVNYDYGTTDNNGNVKSQTINVPSINPLVQTYNYDSLNRIKSAQETSGGNQTWKQTFVYDKYGNRNFDAANTTTIQSGCSQAQCNPTIDTTNNRFTTGQGYTYDSSGNLITDAQGRTFVYDAENKQKTVSNGSGTIGTYFYDGDGKRVKKVSAQETTLFVYDASGNMAAEYMVTNSTPQSPTTSYLTNDTLGSPRIITDQAGNVTSRRDFMPFGEEISGLGNRTQALGYQIDNTRQKFTSYERDIEADLDFAQARYYNPKHGRFTSVDPLMASADIINPQTFNRYVYVGNNPINITDPTGLGWGQLNGVVEWFVDDLAMEAKGFTAYAAQVAWSQDGRQMFALNAATGATVQVQNAAEVFREIAKWGGSGAGAIGATAAALGVPVATGLALTAAYVAVMTSGNPIDAGGLDGPAIGRYTINNQIMMQKKADELAKEVNQANQSSRTQGQTSPANPNPNDNKPRYEKSDKHGKEQRGNAAPAPTNGQTTLDKSVQVKLTSPRRVGVDPATGEYVVFDQTVTGVFHGHVRSWDGLTRQMQKSLIDAGQVNKRGKIK